LDELFVVAVVEEKVEDVDEVLVLVGEVELVVT